MSVTSAPSRAVDAASVPSTVHSTWPATIKTVLGATAAVTLVLLAFVWPTYLSKVKNLPVAVAAPPAAAQQLTAGMSASGTFDVQTATSRDDVVTAIKHRDVYGGVVVGATGIEVLTASAASPVAAQALQGAGQHLAEALKAPVQVTDVVPLSSHDSRGAGLAVMALPLAMGGMIGGVLIAMMVTGARRRLAAIAGYGVLAGGLLIGVLHSWLHILQGSFVTEWAAMSLALVATAATVVGLQALIGRVGIALGAIITMFVGNPLSSMSAPLELLPWHWGTIGQFFVPGAAGTLMRTLSYFPDADTVRPWLVLTGWAVGGVALTLIGHHRNDEVVHVDGATEPDRNPHGALVAV